MIACPRSQSRLCCAYPGSSCQVQLCECNGGHVPFSLMLEGLHQAVSLAEPCRLAGCCCLEHAAPLVSLVTNSDAFQRVAERTLAAGSGAGSTATTARDRPSRSLACSHVCSCTADESNPKESNIDGSHFETKSNVNQQQLCNGKRLPSQAGNQGNDVIRQQSFQTPLIVRLMGSQGCRAPKWTRYIMVDKRKVQVRE